MSDESEKRLEEVRQEYDDVQRSSKSMGRRQWITWRNPLKKMTNGKNKKGAPLR